MKDWLQRQTSSLVARLWRMKKVPCPHCGTVLTPWTITQDGDWTPYVYGFFCKECLIAWQDEGEDYVEVDDPALALFLRKCLTKGV